MLKNNGALKVVLDGANIGWGAGEDRFSSEGLQKALDFFRDTGICAVTAFLPSAFLKKRPSGDQKGNALMETEEWTKLHSLVQNERLTLVPAGMDDDVFILEYARRNEAFVVSNDFYQNHVKNAQAHHPSDASVSRSMTHWLKANRCGYAFVQVS